jgi:hypothetical protein
MLTNVFRAVAEADTSHNTGTFIDSSRTLRASCAILRAAGEKKSDSKSQSASLVNCRLEQQLCLPDRQR